MIYSFELALLRFFHGLDESIQTMIYASDEDLLTALDKAKRFPTLYYSRKEFELNWNKPIPIKGEYNVDDPSQSFLGYNIYPYTQNYVGSIIVEGQREAFDLATKLKYYFNEKPIVKVVVPKVCPDAEIRVALFLDQISIEDVRLPNNLVGSCRMVRFSWHAQLFTVPAVEPLPDPIPFVTQVRLWVDHDGVVQTIFESNPDVPSDNLEVYPEPNFIHPPVEP